MAKLRLRRLPLRLTTGAFVLSAGLDKWKGDERTAAQVHGFAGGTYPFLKQLEPKTFLKALAVSEIGLGAALLLPIALVGAGLTAFSGGLLGLYFGMPGMRRGPRDLRATPAGVPISRDVWMLGAGLALLIDGLTSKD